MKNKILIGVLAFAFVFTMFGVSLAATEWTDDNTFTGIVNWFPNGVKIGQQETGGVTFFNGTIVNETTTDEGGDIPVTFGDNVRIDGEIWRGETAGPGDSLPLKVNDDLLVYGDIDGNGVIRYTGYYDSVSDAITRSFGTNITSQRLSAGSYALSFEDSLTNLYFEADPVMVNAPAVMYGAEVCNAGLDPADVIDKTLLVECYNITAGALTFTDMDFTVKAY